MDIIVGNHDAYFKDNIKTNALNLLLFPYSKNIKIIDNPKTYKNICFIPWICDDNFEYIQNELEYTDAKYVFGHLELNGYEMMPGHVCTHGHDPNLFKKFDAVYSGHFHKKTGHGNITYLGTPWQMTWADYGHSKGFHIFDDETGEIEFIKNPYEMFIKYDYDDKKLSIDNIHSLDYNIFKDRYVKVVIKNKTNHILFDLFIEHIEKSNPIKLQIVEEMKMSIIIDDEEFNENMIEDTTSVIANYIDKIENSSTSKDLLKSTMLDIYNSALNYQSG